MSIRIPLTLFVILAACNNDNNTSTQTSTTTVTTETAQTSTTHTSSTTSTSTTKTQTTTTGLTGERNPKVLIIGFDGLRPDAMTAANTPNLDLLIDAGISAQDAYASDLTWSGPGWASILTGVWWDKHQVTDNKPSSTNIENYPDFFTRMKEAAPELVGASYISWLPINEYILNGADIMFEHDYSDNGDEVLLAQATTDLLNPTLDIDLIFVYFADIDAVGHSYGWNGEAYMHEVVRNDTDVGVLLETLKARPNYAQEDWLILVTSDHGGTGTGHGDDSFTHRNIPFIVSGEAAYAEQIIPAPNQTDIAVTALAHLNIDNNPDWDLDGRVVGIVPPETFTATLGTNLIRNGDAESTRPALEEDHNLEIAYWNDWGQVTTFKYGLLSGYPTTTDPGPKDRGNAYFCGGYGDGNAIEQTIDLSALATEIDTGNVTFKLSGYLGGYASQNDSVTVAVVFGDGKENFMSTAIGPVLANERKNQTGLLYRETINEVPAGSRTARVSITTDLASGSLSDGYADNIKLVLQ